MPAQLGLSPRYEQKEIPITEKQGKLRLIGAKDGREGAVKIYQDVDLYASVLKVGDRVNYKIPAERYAWVQVAKGLVNLNGQDLREGDGIQLVGGQSLEIQTQIRAEFLLFDLA